MNKTLRKLVALVLVLMMTLSVCGASFSAFAETGEVASTVEPDDSEFDTEHVSFIELFYRFLKSIWEFLRYIFYDVVLGKPAPDVPPAPGRG